MLYADVILPLPLYGVYTYLVPPDTNNKIQEGSRVIVQFGKKKFHTAIVSCLYQSEEQKNNIKEIVTILDNHPIVNPIQLRFWEWMASYYMCSVGDIYKAALPSVLKLESETYVLLNSVFESDIPLTAKEQKIFYSLPSTKSLRISEIEKLSGEKNIIPAIKSLAEKGAVLLNEDIKKNYSEKTQAVVYMTNNYSEKELNHILDDLKKTKKQQQLLITFLHLSSLGGIVTKKALLEEANTTPSTLNELVRKNILRIDMCKESRFDYGETNINTAHQLNIYQQQAYEEINKNFEDKNVVLLHGVTSSGKTEIYIQLIKDVMAQGKQVLYLLPEIALTTQITSRLKIVFGNKMGVYHSKFNDNERADIWNKLLTDNECQLILGARSAIFMPFSNLGLIVVDEEHESSYKQQDTAPRYNARNAAIVLAGMCKAKILLGSATPSIETYANALAGRYGLVKLNQRYDDIALPRIETINVKELKRTKKMKSTILSPPLIESIKEALKRKEQIILFQNRRGFSSMIECKTCSWVPRCTHCDVSLTYHKGQRIMICHYCGATYPVPAICPECNTPSLDNLGYGTERVEEEVSEQCSGISIARMDLDTTRSKRGYERIISDFENKKTDILIGTQMVSKGLDFDNVSIVGILNADNLLNYPDFRAHERAFQLMTQVSGRAGRKNKQGYVLLQTSHPSHPIITFVKENDYEPFYRLQMDERKMFRYPPYFRLIAIIIRGREESTVDSAAKLFSQSLQQSFGERVLGPTKPPVARIQSLYIRKILLKIENQASVTQVRDSIYFHRDLILNNEKLKSVVIHFDVDPV